MHSLATTMRNHAEADSRLVIFLSAEDNQSHYRPSNHGFSQEMRS